MIEILLFFIGASLLLYVVLGGADYGAGILELLPTPLKEERKKTINYAMGPVWEANHMWLILIVVILFMGFPLLFTTLMTALHLPMVALLLGIVIRGSAFTFRHYDAIQAPQSQSFYTWLFGLSSLWSAIWLGIIFASLNRGYITQEPQSFFQAYVAPWWGLYPLATGFFVVFIFAFLAAIYLHGEATSAELRQHLKKQAQVLNVLLVIGGGVVFLTSYLEQGHLARDFFRSPPAMLCLGIATLLFFALWFFVSKRRVLLTRVIAAGQVTLILLGWLFLYAPQALLTDQGGLSFYETAAPEATLWQLTLALCVGSFFIFPSLGYLFYVFKKEGLTKNDIK